MCKSVRGCVAEVCGCRPARGSNRQPPEPQSGALPLSRAPGAGLSGGRLAGGDGSGAARRAGDRQVAGSTPATHRPLDQRFSAPQGTASVRGHPKWRFDWRRLMAEGKPPAGRLRMAAAALGLPQQQRSPASSTASDGSVTRGAHARAFGLYFCWGLVLGRCFPLPNGKRPGAGRTLLRCAGSARHLVGVPSARRRRK